MKKICLLALFVLGLSLGAAAADFGGKKFYINPGHGGHDSNDRPTALPLGVAMFYESDGNLDRGKHLYDYITNNNGKAKMSRTTNTSADDLALSTIASYANSYGGYFISLHSNGANASANYICSFFRSEGNSTTNSNEAISGSKNMAKAVVNWQDAVTLSNQTYETPRAMADYPFYGYHLGVLRTNNRPGYLLETWFHDYRPEALRMKSTVYNKFLAWQIARAALENPGGSGTLKAVVQGDIRDLSKSCGYTNYTTRGRDKYLAINGATVKLLDSSGNVVSTMTTDNCANGYYAFFISSTGTYTIQVSKAGYKTATKTVKVSALSTQQTCTFDLTEGVDNGISVSPAAVDFGNVSIGTPATSTITVTGTGLSSTITASIDNTDFTLSATSLAAAGGKITITANPTSAGAKSATLTLKSGTITKTVLVNATAVNPPLTLKEIWNYSETSGVDASWTSDKAAIRNMCYGNGNLFVVKHSTAEILVIDARTGEQVGTVNTTGVDGGTLKLMDVQYLNGKLLATNLATTTAPILKVYIWNDGYESAPTVLLNTTDLAGFSRIGDTFSIKGDLTSGQLLYAAGSNNEANKIVMYAITDGVVSTTPTTLNISEDGTENIALGSSPRVFADGDKYWVNGQNYYPSLVNADGLLESTLSASELKNVYQGNSFTTFQFRGSSYGAAVTYLPKAESATNQTITAGRAVLFDGSDGWASASSIGEYPSAGLGTTRNTTFSTSIAVNVIGEDCVEMWVLVNNQGIAYYRYGEILTPAVSASTSALSFATEASTPVSKEVTIEGSSLQGDITLALSGDDAHIFSLSTSTISASEGKATVTITYSPEEAGTHTATLTVTSKNAAQVDIALSGTAVEADSFDYVITELTEGWVYSEIKGNTTGVDWLVVGSTTAPWTRDVAYANGKLYVLNGHAWQTTSINILDAKTGVKQGSLSVSGVTGGQYTGSSLCAIDDKIVLCNQARATDNLKVYIWDDDASAPRTLLNIAPAARESLVLGGRMNVWGDLTNGKLLFCDETNIVIFPITDGVVSTTYTKVTIAETLGNANLGMADVTLNDDGTFWVTAKDTAPTHVAADGSIIETVNSKYANGYSTAARFIQYGTKKYLAAATYLNKTNTSLAEGALALTDITDGINNGEPQLYPCKDGEAVGLGTTRNTVFAQDVEFVVDGKGLHIWSVTEKQGIGYWYYKYGVSSAIDVIDTECALVYNGNEVTLQGAQAARISVYAVSGTPVADVTDSNTLDVSMLNHGVYIVRAIDCEGNVITRKIMK